MKWLDRMRGMRTFTTVWLGQVASQLGTGLTGFGLGVYVFERTHSVTLFGLLIFAASLPSLVLMPLSGALVDRWDRRRVMIVADVGSGLCTVALAALLWAGTLQVWQICAMMALLTVFGELQMLAFAASIALLVPREHLGRASGLLQTGASATQVLSPVVAGILVQTIGLRGVLLIDFCTYLVAIGATLAVRFPTLRREGARSTDGLRRDLAYGWRFIAARPGLLGLLAFFCAVFFAHSLGSVLFTPLALSFTTAAGLGVVLSVGSVGGVVGGMLMSTWGGPRRRVAGALAAGCLAGVSMMLAGARPSVAVMGAGFFGMFATMPILLGSLQVVWQTKTPLEAQGRVFAIRRMIPSAMALPAYLLAGPLADRVFEPMLARGGVLSGSVGAVIGVGPGRGVGFLFVLAGLVPVVAALAVWLSPRVRNVEAELPEALPEPAPVREPRVVPEPEAVPA
jgi:MFS transporter, DHA3 family, macrolide efflux protein